MARATDFHHFTQTGEAPGENWSRDTLGVVDPEADGYLRLHHPRSGELLGMIATHARQPGKDIGATDDGLRRLRIRFAWRDRGGEAIICVPMHAGNEEIAEQFERGIYALCDGGA